MVLKEVLDAGVIGYGLMSESLFVQGIYIAGMAHQDLERQGGKC